MFYAQVVIGYIVLTLSNVRVAFVSNLFGEVDNLV